MHIHTLTYVRTHTHTHTHYIHMHTQYTHKYRHYIHARARPCPLRVGLIVDTHIHTYRIESRSLRSLLRPADCTTAPPLTASTATAAAAPAITHLPPPRAGPVTFTCFSRFVVPSVSVCLCVWYPILRPQLT